MNLFSKYHITALLMKIIFYVLILCSLSHKNFAQNEIKFVRLDAEDGLSQNDVLEIIQDKYGFIWIGTQDGLNRFDGYNFKIYNHGDSETSLTSNYIFSVFSDSKKNIWIGTEFGLNKYEPSTNTFSKYYIASDDDRTVAQNSIWAICEDLSGNIWLGTQGGLYKMDKSSNEFTEYKQNSLSKNSISNDYISSLVSDTQGNLWIGTRGDGIDKFNISTGKFTNYNIKNYKSLKSNYINCFFYSKKDSNKLWIGTEKGLSLFDIDKTKFLDYPIIKKLHSKYITTITEDYNDVYWIGTKGTGLYSYDQRLDNLQEYKYDPDDPSSIKSSTINKIFIDRSNLIWIGTQNGINKLVIKKQNFKTYTLPEEYPYHIINNIIFPMVEDKNGVLWLGSDNGLNKFDRKSGNVKSYRNIPGNNNSLSNNLVRSMVIDKDDNIWISNYRGVDKFNPTTEKFKHFHLEDKSIKVKTVFLLDDKKGSIWASTTGNGLYRINQKSGEIKNYRQIPGETEGLSSNHICPLELSKDGDMWVGTYYSGILKYNFTSDKFSKISVDDPTMQSFNDCTVMILYEDSDGVLWIGSYGTGLYKYNPATNSLKQYTVLDGLTNNVIYGILEDNQKNLWLSTNNGVSKFNIINESFRNFSTKDGLPCNEFNGSGYLQTKSGEMFFSGTNGFISFFPEKITEEKKTPDLVFTDLKLFGESIPIGETTDGRSILKTSLQATETIKLSYEDFPFSIEYAALDYKNPEQINYAYIMENYNKSWNYVGNRRFVSYNLPPGDYIFKVSTTNNSKTLNSNELKLKIIVTPPFWDTALFKFIIGLTIIMIFITIYRYRIYNLNKQKQWLEINNEKLNKEIDRRIKSEKEKELLNTMLVEKNKELEQIIYVSSHDLRSPLVNIQGYSQELINVFDNITSQISSSGESKDLYKYLKYIKTNTDKMASLIQGLLEFSRIGRDKTIFKKVNINYVFEKVLSNFKDLIDKNQLTIEINHLPDCYGDTNQLFKVFNHIITNSIQFAHSDKNCIINISGERKDKFCNYIIADNGIGIDKNYQDKIFDIFHRLDPEVGNGMGVGLAVVNKIIKNHFGKIEVHSEAGRGTKFIISIPYSDPKHH